MRILLINSVHTAIGSRIPSEHLPPLGLLAIGGPLIDAGHEVHLLDADIDAMPIEAIVSKTIKIGPGVILLGHSGSSSAHPGIADMTRAIKEKMPKLVVVYGGVYPTFSWEHILETEPQIDIIVRGEGEETALNLITAFETDTPLENIQGIAFRKNNIPFATPEAPLPSSLDDLRIGWELIDHTNYKYWGNRRAVVIQFSRGCPHSCSYCGQQSFWKRWRHRDPKLFAAEIARLYREHGVEVFNFADENPTASRSAWEDFLHALIAENVPVTLVGSTRTDDIVRDADILHLYKKAGVARFLLGIEHYKEDVLEKINKGGTTDKDKEAIRLLRKHNILSMATYVVGFEEEKDRDYLYGLKKLMTYDPDQIQMLYVAPHQWTAFSREESERIVIQPDLRKWDYKHQVLKTRHVPPWRVLLWVKFIEAVMQGRPSSIKRLLTHPDKAIRASIQWYYQIGRKVWPYEIVNFINDKLLKNGPTLAEYQTAPNKNWMNAERENIALIHTTGKQSGMPIISTHAA